MIVAVEMSDTFVNAEKVYEGPVTNYIKVTSTGSAYRRYSVSVGLYKYWRGNFTPGYIKTDGTFFSKGKHGVEFFVIEANDISTAVKKALAAFELGEKK